MVCLSFGLFLFEIHSMLVSGKDQNVKASLRVGNAFIRPLKDGIKEVSVWMYQDSFLRLDIANLTGSRRQKSPKLRQATYCSCCNDLEFGYPLLAQIKAQKDLLRLLPSLWYGISVYKISEINRLMIHGAPSSSTYLWFYIIRRLICSTKC